jgi:putative transposase
VVPDGSVQHVINRGDHRETIFHKPADFRAFLALMAEAAHHVPMRILAYCIMRNHFHFVLWPLKGRDLSAYMQRLMNTHIGRYLKHYPPASRGHLYQGRYQNFTIQSDHHLLKVMHYVEANPVAARVVWRAEHYKWSSASRDAEKPGRPVLAVGPVEKPRDWLEIVNRSLSTEEVERIQRSVRRGTPFGSRDWVYQLAVEHDLLHTIRPRGRPPIDESMLPVD